MQVLIYWQQLTLSIFNRPRILLILSSFLYLYCQQLQAQSIVTAAGTANWTVNGTTNITEVTLNRNGTLHSDGFDGAMSVNVTGSNISFTNSYHLSQTYGAAVQHIAVTNNGGSPSTFTLNSYGNLGSDSYTRWHYASTSGTRYTISSDNASASSNGSDPVISIIYGNAALNGLTISMPYSTGDDNTSFTLSNVPIAAGQTRRFLIVIGIGNIDDNLSNAPNQAYTAVQNLATGVWPADFTSFLSTAQKAEVMNWSALTVLPVNWSGFVASLLENKVKLEWKTASETNSRDFIIQHSSDGRNWRDIGSTIAAGQSTHEITYTYWHHQPMSGTNHYRILQNDIDGKSSYSKVLKVVVNATQAGWTLLQNPISSGMIQAQLPKRAEMHLYNGTGSLVWKRVVAAGVQQLDVSNLPKGIYFLEGNGQTQRILLQ